MGDCHVKLKSYSEAASWFMRSYQFHLENDELSQATEDVTCKLLKAYREQNESTKAWEIIHTLDSRLKNNKTWLSSMLENPMSELHQNLILLTRDHETYTTVDTYYDKTIKGADEEARESGARHFLEFSKGRLHIYCGPSDTRKLVLPRWEAIASQLRDNDNRWSWWTRSQLIQEYIKAWISLSSQPTADQHDEQEEINKLSKLSEINSDLNAYSIYYEAKISLARFLSNNDQLEEARAVLKPFIQKALEQARTPDNAQDGYERLALILPAINDDVNALAAWFAMSPLLVKEDDGSKDSHTLPTTDSILSDSTEPAATAGATEHSYSSDEDDSPDKSDEDKEDSDDHSRGIAFFCDGDCGRSWEYADDIWICRDCLCVQLDTSCLEKLRRSELPITICDPKHEHLHVPPFDKLAWKSIGSDDLKVGSDVMSRDAWLAMLEQEWGIEK
jgi:tetratricopeptide (TPR) repeat protein